ncbi:hypothetical protein B0H63DRAFT_90719 [Podospora didyma]|uniref:WSC domain-containing protein n=1 Tax=Podospora didyma TaxID=330526 RepID=A0AAE0JYP7_9PEZI|nr:hypothetical protein B0H63DRAFT_90719 [Podospora didyma]
MRFSIALAAFAAFGSVSAEKKERTFAVLRHYGKGPLTTCRVDPIINPGAPSSHTHMVMGASNFAMNATGESLRQSRCTTALPKADLSAYWVPQLYFIDPITKKFEAVEMLYMNVYYFFEPTNDDIKSFPIGLQMVSGNAGLRTAPTKNGDTNLDPSKGPVQPASITCPRSNDNTPAWPLGSDGSMAGMQSVNNKGEGIGFPFQDCDGYASPMRMDLHFPSCYNPAAGLTNYKTNTVFPSDAGSGKHDCPPGWLHMPHIFYEVYWNTHKLLPRFKDMIGKESPFVWANGDATGFSVHGDFIAAWDEDVLQHIIDTCDTGGGGIHECPGLQGGVNDRSTQCTTTCEIEEDVFGPMDKLAGNNPVRGWQYGTGDSGSGYGGGTGSGSGSGAGAGTPSSTPKAPATTSSSNPSTSLTVEDKPESSAPVIKEVVSSPSPVPTTLVSNTKPAPTSAVSAPPIPDGPGGAGGAVEPKPDGKTTTVWETATVWMTTTVIGGAGAAAPTGAPQPSGGKTDVAGFKYAGCYKDTNARVLDGEIRPNLGRISNTNCVSYCASKGFKVAGTEYGGQCYCGNSLVGSEKLAEASCNMVCEGAKGETCGGDWALSVFTADGSVPGVKAKRHLHNHLHHHRNSPIYRR